MTKTSSRRYKGNVGTTISLDTKMEPASLYILTGVFVSAVIFFSYWLFAWNNSITQVVLINGIDMAKITWVNILIDPVAQGAAFVNAPSMFFWTVGIFAIVVFSCFLIPALVAMKK